MSRISSRNRVIERRTTSVDSLSHDGKGVAHPDGKAVFIEGALPGEEVVYETSRKGRRYDTGQLVEIITPSADRVEPACPHFGICGGCRLQHISPRAQVHHKQDHLLNCLQRIGNIQPGEVLEPLAGSSWHYRRKARLGVKYVTKKNRVLVGFRETNGRYVADLTRCEILHDSIADRLTELAELVASLSIRDKIPQVEFAAGDVHAGLVFRVLAQPTGEDLEKLAEFAENTGLYLYIQTGGEDTVSPVWPVAPVLAYQHEKYNVWLEFRPTQFAQINGEINTALVERCIELMQPRQSDFLLDLFCGIGNFTLPMARLAGHVTGVEGDATLVDMARYNAKLNGMDNVRFHAVDLARNFAAEAFMQGNYNKVLLDPPRTGARELIENMQLKTVERIVYVSCNPATFARDAGMLVGGHGFVLEKTGIVDMFPHTAHAESIALFTRKQAI
jgi:23S rRNA (uracil1939-C5)-methyltransferase